MKERSVSIHVIGRVQGVWYRSSTKREADRLKVRGIVRNEPDGSVYIEAIGEAHAIEAFIDWCKQGPELARVRDVQVNEMAQKPLYTSFEVDR